MRRFLSCTAIAAAVLLCSGPEADAQNFRSQIQRGRQKAGNQFRRGNNNRNRGNQQGRRSQRNRRRGQDQLDRGNRGRRVEARIPGAINGQFTDFQIDGDRVNVLVRPLDEKAGPNYRDTIRIALEADGTWLKAVIVFDKNGREYKVEQKDGGYTNGRRYIDVPESLLPDRFKIEFWAAKFLGVPTRMITETYFKSDFVGKRTKFVWQQGLEGAADDLTKDPEPINEIVKVDGKNVRVVSREGGSAGYLTLELDTTIDWWSAVIFKNRLGQAQTVEREHGTGAYSTNGARGPRRIRVPLDSLDSQVTLEFWQAKAFGVHTFMTSKKFTKGRFDGRIVAVIWRK